MIGQKNLKQRLQSLEAQPRFLLIVGPRGSGKYVVSHWIVRLLWEQNYEYITDLKIDSIRSVIDASRTLSAPKTFVFPDTQDMNIQAQNAFLKSLEEPNNNAHYIWTVNSEWNILTTIRSRAFLVRMDAYSKDELKNFTEDEALLRICTTPGQILRYESFDYVDLIQHCEKIVAALGRINIGNVFNILKAVKEENYDLIIPVLQYVYEGQLTPESAQHIIRQLRILQETSTTLEHSSTVNVRNALETMFLKLWEVAE